MWLLGGKDDTTGSVTIPTEVSEGTSLWVTRRDYEKLTNGIDRVAEEIKAQLGGNPAKLVFQFDCAGRGKIFMREQQKLRLLERLRQQIGAHVPWLGFYTFGEISPVGGHNCFHNYTVVLTAIHEEITEEEEGAIKRETPPISEEKLEALLTKLVGDIFEKVAREAILEVAEKVLREEIDVLKKSMPED